MGRVSKRVIVITIGILSVAGSAVVPAGAQSAKTPDDLAKKYQLLRESDLPDGYALDDVRRDTGSNARSVEVTGDCDEINPEVTFLGSKPVITYAAFSEPAPSGSLGGNGLEFVYAFSSETDAKEYYGRWAGGFDELAACGLMTTPSGVIGTYAALDVGKAGNQRTGITFDARTNEEFARLAVARDGKTVVSLALAEDDITDAEFGTLVKTALKRAP